jgi:hypothetical protein
MPSRSSSGSAAIPAAVHPASDNPSAKNVGAIVDR